MKETKITAPLFNGITTSQIAPLIISSSDIWILFESASYRTILLQLSRRTYFWYQQCGDACNCGRLVPAMQKLKEIFSNYSTRPMNDRGLGDSVWIRQLFLSNQMKHVKEKLKMMKVSPINLVQWGIACVVNQTKAWQWLKESNERQCWFM